MHQDAGIYERGVSERHLRCGASWMSANIMIAEHPYYTVTDKNGSFTIDNVPAGTYTLRLWHEGVAIMNKGLDPKKITRYFYEEPYTDSLNITVSPNATAEATFELTLR